MSLSDPLGYFNWGNPRRTHMKSQFHLYSPSFIRQILIMPTMSVPGPLGNSQAREGSSSMIQVSPEPQQSTEKEYTAQTCA